MDSNGANFIGIDIATFVLMLAYGGVAVSYWFLRRRLQIANTAATSASPRVDLVLAMLNGLAENVRIGIFMIRADDKIAYANPALLSMFGSSNNSSGYSPETKSFLAAVRRHALCDDTIEFQHSLHRGDGMARNFNITGLQIADPIAGAFIVGTVTDISQQLELEFQLRAVKQDAEKANLIKSIAFANMSHEIRTPLTAIIGYSDLLEQRLKGTELHSFARTIYDGGRRLVNLLNGIIDLARIDSGKCVLAPVPQQLLTSVERVVALQSVLARKKELSLEVAIDSQLTVFADSHAMEQIWTNLISNAIRFTENGKVIIRAERQSSDISVLIEDTGIGIADWFLPHVFEEFKQETEHEEGIYEGSGLGLPITKRLVERSGGTIRVTSKKGMGTQIEVRLPASAPVATCNEEGSAEYSLPEGKRILLVEDDPECGYLVSELLAPGNQVHWFQKPAPALEFARTNPVDVVLLDINLRDREYDGTRLLRKLRQLADYDAVPIIAVTAYAILGDRARFLAEGFNGYVAKPFDMREFDGTLRNILASQAHSHLH